MRPTFKFAILDGCEKESEALSERKTLDGALYQCGLCLTYRK
jgi:hypothetical protein